jgi:hypothetical protein
MAKTKGKGKKEKATEKKTNSGTLLAIGGC